MQNVKLKIKAVRWHTERDTRLRFASARQTQRLVTPKRSEDGFIRKVCT